MKRIRTFVLNKYPTTRYGWYQYYADRYSKDITNTQAEHLACWYLFLYLAFDVSEEPDLIEVPSIDWDLLAKQKAYLVTLASNQARNPMGTEYLDGVIHLLDNLQDKQMPTYQ